MNRTLIAAATAALITLAGLGQAMATTYIVYTSQFEVTSTTGCEYDGAAGSLVTLPNGSEGCMVEQGMVAGGDDALAESALDAELAVEGGDEGPSITYVGTRR